MTVTVFGEALVDVVDRGGVRTAAPGGSPANVAVGLGRLGVEVVLHTSIADDPHGRLVAEHLRVSDVMVTGSSWSARRTSSAVAAVDSDGTASYEFDVSWDPAPAASPVGAVFHTGSIAAVLEPGAHRVRDAVAAAKAAGALVTFDPNVRPELIADARAGRQRILDLLQLADVVKLSDEDAAWLFPHREVDAILEDVLILGPRLVAVTRGGEGSVIATGSERVECPSVRVAAVDTIGAGDTYMAALIAAVVEDRELFQNHAAPPATWLRDVAEFASAAAAVTVGRRGADLPWAAELVHAV